MNDSKKNKMRLPVITMLLLVGIFGLGGIAGAFMYATGVNVINSPFMSMVSHTEYRYNETGQIIARLVDYQGAPVNIINCTATIIYPDKSFFVNQALMANSTNVSGDHYYNFTTPSGPEGIYEYQATCYYLVGAVTKNASVTNSFHLSSALGNLQSSLDNLSVQVSNTNASLSAQISNLSSQIDANMTSLSTQLNDNVTQILAATSALSANVTQVQDSLAALNTSIDRNFTVAFSYLGDINTTSNNIYSVLLNVNTTTTNTYQYLTGTLTTSVDQALTDLGVINATVNRIETNTVDINATVNTILTNQQDTVKMDVFSG